MCRYDDQLLLNIQENNTKKHFRVVSVFNTKFCTMKHLMFLKLTNRKLFTAIQCYLSSDRHAEELCRHAGEVIMHKDLKIHKQETYQE